MKAGIVLGEWVENGVLSYNSMQRVEAGVELLKGNIVDLLILSGGVRKRPGYKKLIGNYNSLAEIMENYAIKKGANKNKIILEDLSEETVGQIIFIKYGFFEPMKINEGIIITNDYHAPRIFEITDTIFGDNNKLKYHLISSNSDERKKRSNAEAFRKTFEGINFESKEDVLKTLFKKHPFYNHNPDFYKKELNKLILKNSE